MIGDRRGGEGAQDVNRMVDADRFGNRGGRERHGYVSMHVCKESNLDAGMVSELINQMRRMSVDLRTER